MENYELHMASAEREPITAVWGSRVRANCQEVRGKPPEDERFSAFEEYEAVQHMV